MGAVLVRTSIVRLVLPLSLLALVGCGGSGSQGVSTALSPGEIPAETGGMPAAPAPEGVTSDLPPLDPGASSDLPAAAPEGSTPVLPTSDPAAPPPATPASIPPATPGGTATPSPAAPSPAVPTPTPSPEPPATTLPQIRSISAPTTVTAGQQFTLSGEVSTPAGLKQIRLEISGLGFSTGFTLSPAEVGCTRGDEQCTVQGNVTVPPGLAGTYEITLTVIDLLDQTDSTPISIQVQ